MTKADLAEVIHQQVTDVSKTRAAELVSLIFETLKETLGRGQKIKISGFGNFLLRDKRERTGRNPKTSKPMLIRSRRVLTFRPSPVLREELNAHRTASQERTRL
ncbi:MAG: integration host factor subunit alpha [Myxococcales bacterium]|nr:integration host factor subunit alpha [Myxococcales bacterium]